MFEELFRIFAEPSAGRRGTGSAAAAVEQVVDGTDPRFRMVSRYRRKLGPAVAASLAFIDDLADRLPSAATVDPAGFGLEPRLRALFSSPEHLREVFCVSRPLRDFLAYPGNRGLGECCVLLTARRRQKTVLGVAMENDILQREVMRQAVYFDGYQVITPAAEEGGLRQKLKERLFNDLLEVALARMVAMRQRGERLESRRRLLRAKLRTLAGKDRFGVRGELSTSDLGTAQDPDGTAAELESIEAELSAVRANPATLEEYLEVVIEVIGAPQESLGLGEVSLRPGRTGIEPDDGGGAGDERFTVPEIRYEGNNRVVAVPLRLTPPLVDAVRAFHAGAGIP